MGRFYKTCKELIGALEKYTQLAIDIQRYERQYSVAIKNRSLMVLVANIGELMTYLREIPQKCPHHKELSKLISSISGNEQNDDQLLKIFTRARNYVWHRSMYEADPEQHMAFTNGLNCLKILNERLILLPKAVKQDDATELTQNIGVFTQQYEPSVPEKLNDLKKYVQAMQVIGETVNKFMNNFGDSIETNGDIYLKYVAQYYVVTMCQALKDYLDLRNQLSSQQGDKTYDFVLVFLNTDETALQFINQLLWNPANIRSQFAHLRWTKMPTDELSSIQKLYLDGTFELLYATVKNIIDVAEAKHRQNRQNSNGRQRMRGDDIPSPQSDKPSESKRKHSGNAGADEKQEKRKKKRYEK